VLGLLTAFRLIAYVVVCSFAAFQSRAEQA
jgi:hypothetical protein